MLKTALTRRPRSNTPYQFFLANAGYSYDPKSETPMQGRRRGARALAEYERVAREAGCSFEWSVDPDSNSGDWITTRGHKPYCVWQCIARTDKGEIFASLHSIDFGRHGEPFSSTYRRVVEAELAGEFEPE